MTSLPVIRVDEPRELLAFLPFQLGVQPRDSLVVVSVRARDRRVGLVARVDLAAFADPADGEATADFLAARLVEDGAGRVVVVVYTELACADVRDPSSLERSAVDQVRAAVGAEADGGAWVVGSTGYASLTCHDEACCPSAGRPLSDLQATKVGAHLVLAGHQVARERWELRVLGEAPAADRRRARQAAAAERSRRRAAEGGRPGGTVSPEWAETILALWMGQCARADDGLTLEPQALGRLLAGLEVPLVRDALVLTVADDDGPSGRPGSLADALGGLGRAAGARPAADRADRARVVLEAMVRHTGGRSRATPLATLACVMWWCGDGTRANVLLEQCLESDPDHRLGRTLYDTVGRGVAPGWVAAETWDEDEDLDLRW